MMPAEGTGAPEDTNAYTIMEKNVVRIAEQMPSREGYDFDGWSLGTDAATYFPGIPLKSVNFSLQFANENNEFVFVANWVEEDSQLVRYNTVEHYYQNPDGTFPAEPVTVILRGTIGREVVALPQERDDYVLDQG